MKGGTQAALAIGVGYLLGRRRKMRMATILAAGAATGGLAGLSGMALRRGMKMLGSSEALGKFAPQLGELADTVRSDLMDAGKAAATAAVTSRIESLTDSLHERAEFARNPGEAAADAGKAAHSAAGKATETARSGAGAATGRPRRRDQEAAGDEDGGEPRDEEETYPDEPGEPEDYESEAEEPERGEPRAARRRTGTQRRPAGPDAPVRRRTAQRRSPVARAGR